MYVDIGQTGSGSDAGVFNESPFKAAIEAGTLNLPEADPVLTSQWNTSLWEMTLLHSRLG